MSYISTHAFYSESNVSLLMSLGVVLRTVSLLNAQHTLLLFTLLSAAVMTSSPVNCNTNNRINVWPADRLRAFHLS